MQAHALPATGFLRQRDIVGTIVPASSSTLWRWVNAGTFPRPVKLSDRVTAWRCEDVRAWLEQHGAESAKAVA